MRRERRLLLIPALLLAVACTESTTQPGLQPGDDAGLPDGAISTNPDGAVDDGFPRSAKARVRFKRSEQLATDFARALDLPVNEVCKDLGRFDCFETHAVSLGGVEAYNAGIYVPLENTTVTTPLAVERIALAGCSNRVDIDGGDLPNGLIFRGLELDADDKLVDVRSQAVADSIARLFQRFMQRQPTSAEVGHLVKLYEDLEADGEAELARTWAVTACFSVATMMEALFY